MKKFDKDKLSDVDVYLGEPNEQVRESMRAMMRGEGFRKMRTFARMDDLLNAIKETPPDLLIAADDMDNLFDIIRDIRHFKIGRNPFIMITLMVRAESDDAVKRAVLAGADDVMIKPVAPGKLLERVAQVTFNRLPFIATTDYVGPERRKPNNDRPSKIRQLDVVNTFKSKLEGRRMSSGELARAVEANMTDVMAARLDSHGLKLGWICGLILKSYEDKTINKELEERILVLVSVLEDAGRTARVLGEPELAQMCTQMAREVEEMAEKYQEPTDHQISTIRKLTKAFEMAKMAKMGPAPHQAEAAQPAAG